MSPPSWTWDRNLQRYRASNGRFITQTEMESLTRSAIAQVGDDLRTVTGLLLDGKIGVGAWEETTALGLRKLQVWSYWIGRGGIKQMTQRDYGIVGASLKEQYKYLRGFSEDILSGRLSKEEVRARLELYLNDTTTALELGREESHRVAGFGWEQRILNARESCGDCVGYAARGWQLIGTLPNRGEQCQCKANCRCHKEYARDKPAQDWIDRQFRWGWCA